MLENVKTTTDINLFAGKPGYDQTLAKLNLDNFGIIYYYCDTIEPLEIEDIIYLLEK